MRFESSVYPIKRPAGSKTLLRNYASDLKALDSIMILVSSIVVVGGVFIVPSSVLYAFRRLRAIPKHHTKKRALYTALLLSAIAIVYAGPQKTEAFTKRMNVHGWRLWKSWLKYLSLTVILDRTESRIDLHRQQHITAISPHGIIPVSLGFAGLGDEMKQIFGKLRLVIATASSAVPFISDIVSWVGSVDASHGAIDRSMRHGTNLAIAPGGIAEMFEGFPKELRHPNEEVIIARKGIMRMAIRHGVPIVPVFCFGSSRLLKRLQLPNWIEQLSLMLRASFVVFFGRCGLPIPFQQRFLYVMGEPIAPPSIPAPDMLDAATLNKHAAEMRERFCEEMVRVFDRYKESYGWHNKHLVIL